MHRAASKVTSRALLVADRSLPAQALLRAGVTRHRNSDKALYGKPRAVLSNRRGSHKEQAALRPKLTVGQGGKGIIVLDAFRSEEHLASRGSGGMAGNEVLSGRGRG